ncbi:MAG: YlqD family protein [Phascolarctobacterium sp.]|nr:YlqD family protein [Candidatus Phascolarctobacterium caballi]MCQ2380782.1 YlqD family protein [Acidaminococcaceae bacterium]
MEEMLYVRVPIAVKAKVTENTKMKIIADLKETVKQMTMDLESFDFEAQRALKEAASDLSKLPVLRQQIDMRREELQQEKDATEAKLERAEALQIGAEIGHGTLERTVAIKVGMDLDALMGAEIVTEDGKIIAFRE